MYSDVRTIDLDLRGKQFYRLEQSAYVQFLALVLQAPLICNYLGQLPLTYVLFSEVT